MGRGGRSGTEDYFEEKVIDGERITGNKYRVSSSKQVIEAVVKHKYTIGYVEVGYFDTKEVKIFALSDKKSSQAVLPQYKNLKNGIYPIIRPLYILTLQNANQDVKDFMNFVLSEEGQNVIKEAGYLPIKEKEE